MIIDNDPKGPAPTIPDDTTDPPRFAQPVETTKDAFILELRKFFDREYQTANKIQEVPNIRKYDVSFKPNESSQETAVNLIQKFPDISENLPLIAVLGATGRNLPMSIGGQYMATVHYPPLIESTIIEPYVLMNGQTIIYKTITTDGTEYTTTIILRNSRFANIGQATAAEVIDEINFQSLYGHGLASDGKVQLIYGGPINSGSASGTIEIVGGTAITALGFTIGHSAAYTSVIPYHRYHQATSLDIGIEIVAEDYNIRTELNDLVWSFFTYFMDTRDFTFLGRSVFTKSIPDEWYQVIIKPELTMSGEQEVPRPGDEKDKLFVNRINISVTTIQYIDKAVLIPGTTTPLYINKDGVAYDDTIPQKN